MSKILDLIKGKISGDPEITPLSQEVTSNITSTKTWFEERYETALVQRNWVFFLAAIAIIAVAIAVIAVTKISLSKEFDPFVIQIENSTGLAKVVNPISSEILGGNDALARYFLKKYVVARETYNPVDFETRARQVVRLLSTSQVYNAYMGYIKSKENDPTILYGQKNTTFLTIRSWSKLDAKRYVFRFAINETMGDKRVFNKIAILDYDYVAMSLNSDDEDINPVGFQIKGYRVDDDNS